MINIYRDLLLNLFIVYLPVMIYPSIIKTGRDNGYTRTIMAIIFSLALVTTMSFPVMINGIAIDLRTTALSIGALYGGVYVSLFLYAVVIIYRFLLGSPNQIAYIISFLPTFLVIICFVLKFRGLSLIQKVVTSIIVFLSIRFLTLAAYLYLIGKPSALWNYSTNLVIVVQCAMTAVFVYVLETFKRNAQYREEMIRSEKMKIVSDMAASVAHEVRNPLTSVRGFIQLMGKDDLAASNRQYYQKICLEELDRAEQIISDYLTFAKPEPEKIEVIEIKSEIDYVANVLTSYANYQNVQIFKQMQQDELLIVGDKNKLRQALINIGKNSIEAMPDGGILTFTAHPLNGHVVISIGDTGIGMSKEQMNRLGTPYYSTKDKGTGLGTMVSFSIIRKMQGKIEVTSEVAKGTTYMITLALLQAKSHNK
jgi:two-component system sporulation sensor kinase B